MFFVFSLVFSVLLDLWSTTMDILTDFGLPRPSPWLYALWILLFFCLLIRLLLHVRLTLMTLLQRPGAYFLRFGVWLPIAVTLGWLLSPILAIIPDSFALISYTITTLADSNFTLLPKLPYTPGYGSITGICGFVCGATLVWFVGRISGGYCEECAKKKSNESTPGCVNIIHSTGDFLAAVQQLLQPWEGWKKTMEEELRALRNQITQNLTTITSRPTPTVNTLATPPSKSTIKVMTPTTPQWRKVTSTSRTMKKYSTSPTYGLSIYPTTISSTSSYLNAPSSPKTTPIPTSNRFAVLEDTTEDYVREFPVITSITTSTTPAVHIIKAAPKKKSRPQLPATISQSSTSLTTPTTPPVVDDDLTAALKDKTVSEALTLLREKEKQYKDARKDPTHLTEEEKQMTLDQLYRKWKVERLRRRQELADLRISDFAPLGELTEEQKSWPRANIQRLIRLKKQEQWVEAMKSKGIEVYSCDVCYKLYTDNHQCLATQWQLNRGTTTSTPRGVIVTQSASGVRLRATEIIDPDKLTKELEAMRRRQEELLALTKLVQPSRTLELKDEDMSEATGPPAAPPEGV